MLRGLYIILFSLLQLALMAQRQEKFINEGNDFYKKGQLEKAIDSYDRVTDAALKPTALLNKGTALYKLKNYDEAIKTYQAVGKLNSADAEQKASAYYNAGVVFSNQNKIAESIEAYKNALRLNWKDEDARENLQKALAQLPKNKSTNNNDPKPQQQPSKLDKNQAQQQLERLQQKERNTQSRVSDKKKQYAGSNGKDW